MQLLSVFYVGQFLVQFTNYITNSEQKWRSRPTEFKLKFTQVWIMHYETPSAALFSLMCLIALTDWKNSCV